LFVPQTHEMRECAFGGQSFSRSLSFFSLIVSAPHWFIALHEMSNATLESSLP